MRVVPEIHIACPGGFLSTGLMEELARTAHHNRVGSIRITHRQNLALSFCDKYSRSNFISELDPKLRVLDRVEDNIMSSAFTHQPGVSSAWLSESRMLEFVQSLPNQTSMSISVVDGAQNLVPLFESNLNLIASPIAHHWYIAWSNQSRVYIADYLIPSFKMAQFCKLNGVLDFEDLEKVSATLKEKFKQSLLLPPEAFKFSNKGFKFQIEGFHEIESSLNLGLFKNSLVFSDLLLDELGYLCRKTGIGRVHLTAKHSMFIKNINKEFILDWKKFIKRRGLNLRHNQNELAWRLSAKQNKLRDYLVKKLSQEDLGLGNTICSIKASNQSVSADIIISCQKRLFQTKYAIALQSQLTTQAAPLNRVVAESLSKKELAVIFLNLVRESHSQLTIPIITKDNQKDLGTQNNTEQKEAYQCQSCLGVYYPMYGDILSEVKPHTSWSNLPDGYTCPVCSAPKSKFQKTIDLGKLNKLIK